MTLKEAKVILVDRLGWRDDKTVENMILDATNLKTDSERYFQSEHSAITLENIRDCQPQKEISAKDFNTYLTNLTVQCVIQVLGDVFEKDYLHDDLLTLYPTAFDEVISLKMVINVSELIMTSSRKNQIKRLTDAFIGKLNYDIFRDAPNKFAIRGANYRHSMGISSRYNVALRSVQRRFGTQKNMLKVHTRGQAV